MTPSDLEQLATRLANGEVSVADFLGAVARSRIADLGEAQVDLDRHRRCGFPEVVFAQGKSVAAMEKIFQAQIAHGSEVLATRMTAEQAAELLPKFPGALYNAMGRTFRVSPAKKTGSAEGKPPARGRVVIVTAGTSDLPVAEEARETVLWTGAEVTMIQDVGVAGPHRLTANLRAFEGADAVVVVAGMEGALAQRGGRPCRLPGDRGAHERRLRGQLRRHRGAVGHAQ